MDTGHYGDTASINTSQGGRRKPRRARRLRVMALIRIDYDQLKSLFLKRIGMPGMPSQAVAANAVSALTMFLQERQMASADTVGSTLRLSFYQERDAHLATLRPRRSNEYIKNRSSLLGRWHRFVLNLDQEAATLDRAPTPLQQALKAALVGRKIKTVTRLADVPLATLRRWIAGATPRSGLDHYLTRFEEACELPHRALTDLLPYNAVRLAAAPDAPQIAYRVRLAKLTQDHYLLKPALAIATLRAEWRALLAYKTSGSGVRQASGKISALERLRGALAIESVASKKQWRLVPPDPSEILTEERWTDVHSGRVCATASIDFNFVSSFMGWAQMSPERGGRGMTAEAVQTLGVFCDQELMEAYLEWRVERSEGINSWVTKFLSFSGMLLHPATGFLLTRPDIGARCGFEPAAWLERCRTVHEWTNTYKRKISELVTPGRNPEDPLRAALDLAMPLDHFVHAIRRMETCWPTTGGEAEAIHARDLLLMALLLSNPLRSLNLKRLTYKPDNTGQMRQNAAGEWRIFIDKGQFKNVKGAAKKDYDQAVDAAVWPHIRRYLKDYRKMLGDGRPELVFIASERPDRPMKSLGGRVRALTKRYVPNCPGVGPHSIRHIVATSIIMAGGGVELAASTLHDMVRTVQKHYALLLASHGDRGRRETLGRTLAQMAPRPFLPSSLQNPTA